MENIIIKEDLQNILMCDLPWHKFKNKTILISGANGFLPSYMVKTLLFLNDLIPETNLRVIGIARNRKKATLRFGDYIKREDFRLIIQDICMPLIINEKIDYIIHAASQASPKYYSIDPVGTLSANTIGTASLLNLAHKNRVESFLFFSSSEVYGKIDDKFIPTNETDYGYIDPLNVRSCYAQSKKMGENMCASWFHQYNIPTKIVRPFHIYGPGMELNDGRVFADFVSNILNKKNIVLKSDGMATRTFCYLSDATRAFFMVLLKGKNGDAYNVSNNQCEISIKNLADLLVALYPEKKLKVIKIEREKNDNYLPSDIRRSCPDISKVKSLGWQPKYSNKEGFIRTIRSMKND